MTLSYTPLRHKMLAEVASGEYKIYIGLQWNLIHTPTGKWVSGGGKRVMRSILPLITHDRARPGEHKPAALTEAGSTLLSSWDAQYGEVKP